MFIFVLFFLVFVLVCLSQPSATPWTPKPGLWGFDFWSRWVGNRKLTGPVSALFLDVKAGSVASSLNLLPVDFLVTDSEKMCCCPWLNISTATPPSLASLPFCLPLFFPED